MRRNSSLVSAGLFAAALLSLPPAIFAEPPAPPCLELPPVDLAADQVSLFRPLVLQISKDLGPLAGAAMTPVFLACNPPFGCEASEVEYCQCIAQGIPPRWCAVAMC